MICSIVVPIYKNSIGRNEEASFKALLNLLNQYTIYIVCPKNLDCKAYTDIAEHIYKIQLKIVRLDESYFKSIDGYNKLLLSLEFYKSFIRYDFILIYQLDCWIFKNELAYWCSQNYDYIGAPWFEGMIHANENSPFLGVGNGGFSLRKVKSHIKVLQSFAYITPVKELWQSFINQPTLKKAVNLLLKTTVTNNTFYLLNNHSHRKYSFHEDTFWGMIASQRFNWFKVPDGLTASRFSVETNASYLYKLNNQNLPFGCHAWERIEPEFWKQFIPMDFQHP